MTKYSEMRRNQQYFADLGEARDRIRDAIRVPEGFIMCVSEASISIRPCKRSLPSVSIRITDKSVVVDTGKGYKIKSFAHSFDSTDDLVANVQTIVQNTALTT